ncbi:MAG: hypothetical protein H6667_24230 [Ardenticatenaceae bacterium]|nr:hypothetical protein [Ardenticatenaceae bacterium]MCB9444903.1 hypothetical protein [Ardenticatenaceae bacterium]
MEWIVLPAGYLLMSIIFALPAFIWRRTIARSQMRRQTALLLLAFASFLTSFFIIANLAAQVNIVFSCIGYGFDPCYPYAEQAGLSTGDEFRELATKELMWRNVIPPPLQKDCHITETGVCDVLASPDWQGVTSSAFWSALFAGLLSGGITAVAVLFFTRNRANGGKTTSGNGRASQ